MPIGCADYNWKIEPNTGPYQITDVRKGQYIELKRDPNWWANDRKYLPASLQSGQDSRSKSCATTTSRSNISSRGDTDTFGLVLPQFWHEKAKGPVFDNGYIEPLLVLQRRAASRHRGCILNEDDPILKDRNVRIALAYAMNFDSVIRYRLAQ